MGLTNSSANYFNYINMTTHDPSGMLRFVTDELQAAEDAGDRGAHLSPNVLSDTRLYAWLVWLMGHVLPGWDGTNALGNPSDLCKLILSRK